MNDLRPSHRRAQEPRERRLGSLAIAGGSLALGLGLLEVTWPGLTFGGHRYASHPVATGVLLQGLQGGLLVVATTATVWIVALVTRCRASLAEAAEVALLLSCLQLLALGATGAGLRFLPPASLGVVGAVGLVVALVAFGWSWLSIQEQGTGGLILRLVLVALILGETRPHIRPWKKPYRMASASMSPTLMPGDLVLTIAPLEATAPLRRGEVVVFWPPERGDAPSVARVLGTPGDRVHVTADGIAIDGTLEHDAWGWYDPDAPPRIRQVAMEGAPYNASFANTPLPEGQYFLLGDHRLNSHDSRFYGPVRREDIIRYASYRYLPLSRRAPLIPDPVEASKIPR